MDEGLRRRVIVVAVLTAAVLALILISSLFMVLMMGWMMSGGMFGGMMGRMGGDGTIRLIGPLGMAVIVLLFLGGLVGVIAWILRQPGQHRLGALFVARCAAGQHPGGVLWSNSWR